MKRATGNKAPQSANKVSIQLSLDGHSFSAPALTGDFPGNGSVEVELLTPRTMLVPAALYDPAQGAGLLAANGMPLRAGECVAASDPSRQYVALMALPAEALRLVDEKLGSRALFTTPLLHDPSAAEPTVWISRRAEILYVKIYDAGALQMAEAVPAPEDADILYLFERMAAVFPLEDHVLRISGDTPKSLRKLLGKSFRKTICE